ncbi:protein serine/threonine phosphatase [Aureococcus anophagefferens]|nr:protein serine/threonine phosphatase [Aureococcus anophagefferens]
MELLAARARRRLPRRPDDSVVLHVLHNNNSSVVAKHETFPLSDLDATFETPIGATIRDMRRARAFDTELSSRVLARKARATGAPRSPRPQGRARAAPRPPRARESFFKKSFAVALRQGGPRAGAGAREPPGPGRDADAAVAGGPAPPALTLRSLAPGRAPCRSTFVVNASSSAKAPDGSGDRAAWAALCEGHGPQGEQCAKFARDRMEHLVRRAMSAPYATPPAALANAFAALDGALDEARVCGASGCSAAAALLSGDRAYCALLGTCGVVLVTKDRQGCHARELAPRHVLSVAAEADRARGRRAFGSDEALLGVLEAGDGGDRRPRLYAAEEGSTLPGYSFARCLGDPAAKRLGVVAEPSVVEHEFGPGDEFLILASESVFDALRSDAFATICEGQDDPWTVAHLVLAKARRPSSTRGSRRTT